VTSVIGDDDVVAAEDNAVGSGNGTLDWILLTESHGGAENSYPGGFDADDANTDMPTGNRNTAATESYIASVGELRDFYELNFPDGAGGSTVEDMVLFVDLNQVPGKGDLQLRSLDIVIDYDQVFGDSRDDPAAEDIGSSKQNRTGSGYSGGSPVASLDGTKLLPLTNTGAGFADYAIFTGVDPFSGDFTDDTRILFHWYSSGHSGGGETVFLSGEYGDRAVPEPSLIVTVGSAVVAGLCGMGRRKTGSL
jgi:hypothetical protein